MADPGLTTPGPTGLPATRPPGGPAPGAPALGRSLAIDDGDLVIDRTTHGPALVEGFPALVQALVLTVRTQVGTDLLNVGFGFDALAVTRYAEGAAARREHIRMELVRCLDTDPRVTGVREVLFEDDPRLAELAPDRAALRDPDAERASRSHTVYAVVDTVAGTALTIETGGRLE
ncbi:hypothetical protein ACFV0O_38835 [Kitasatospora sp. NPDC059577]|uniref:hypothetical protein n=1 Tax=Kitasatospora sp. NPDC059577 TaxID=3346873 RepID=UPI00369848D2